MARKAKTPEKVKFLMKRQEEMLDWVDECIRVKTTVPVENQANHIKSKSSDYWIGVADGINNLLEQAMFDANCYAGFMYVAPVNIHPDEGSGTYRSYSGVKPDDPEYAGWRRHYFTRS